MNRYFTRGAQAHVKGVSKECASGNRYDLLLQENSIDFLLRCYNKSEGTVQRTVVKYPRTVEDYNQTIATLTELIQMNELLFDSPLMKALR